MKGSTSSRTAWIQIINILIFVVTLGVVYYAFIVNKETSVMILAGVLLLIVVVALGWKSSQRYQTTQTATAAPASITKLVLMNEDGESVKEWYINGETSLLIGKRSNQSEVDIDLSDSEYASLISKEHAVLNYASGVWYIEDIDSRNGTGIQHRGSGTKERLEKESPHKLVQGDIIFVANTRLQIK